MALWMLYATAVALLLAVGLRITEAAFVHTGRARWVWLGGLGLAVTLPFLRPFVAPLVEGWWVGSPQASDLVTLGGVQVLTGLVPEASRLAEYTALVVAGWLGATLALAGITAAGALRIWRERAGWAETEVDGRTVLVSADVGPAVVGLARPRVVLPEWVLRLPAPQRRLIIDHEVEHLRGRDPWLLALGMATAVLMPWNAGVWWSFFRLRHAVETDCDHRVVRGGSADVTSYARLLFEVGTRNTRPVPLGAGFGERTSSLERRIRTMVRGREVGWGGVTVRGVAAAILLVAACSVDNPENPLPTEAEETAVSAEVVQAPVAEPGFQARELAAPDPDVEATGDFAVSRVPLEQADYTVAPAIQNRAEMVAALDAEYPPLLRGAGVGGTVRVWFFLDEEGRVQDRRIDQGSGHQALDDAALRVVTHFRFSPALDGDKPVPVWLSVPITFSVH